MTVSLWRKLLLPLVPVYGGVTGLKRWLLERGQLRQRRLPHGVISVGSISAGGAGKTPIVLLLGRLLQQQGFDLRILTRGYRRNSTQIERVDAAGDASRFGDEPLLLARRLAPASVYAGIDRYRAGILAGQDSPAEGKAIYLLDDGFQHRKLARDVDLVLLTRRELHDRLLPAGNLREPLSALRLADMVIVRENEPDVVEWVATNMPEKRTWTVRRRLQFAAEAEVPQRPVAFSGIARPESFASMLAAKGVLPAATLTFQDHHPYSNDDIDTLLKAARSEGADGFITTEKDAVKLSAGMIEKLQAIGPIAVPELYVELIDEQAKIDELLALLGFERARHA